MTTTNELKEKLKEFVRWQGDGGDWVCFQSSRWEYIQAAIDRMESERAKLLTALESIAAKCHAGGRQNPKSSLTDFVLAWVVDEVNSALAR